MLFAPALARRCWRSDGPKKAGSGAGLVHPRGWPGERRSLAGRGSADPAPSAAARRVRTRRRLRSSGGTAHHRRTSAARVAVRRINAVAPGVGALRPGRLWVFGRLAALWSAPEPALLSHRAMADEGKSYNGQCWPQGGERGDLGLPVGGAGVGRSPGAGGRERPGVRGGRRRGPGARPPAGLAALEAGSRAI